MKTKLVAAGITIGILFCGMIGVMYFVVGQIKPIQSELEITKAVLSERVSELRETEDQLAVTMESEAKLKDKFSAASAKIAELEMEIKLLQKSK